MAAPRILVTRAPHQASELADQLRALGAEPILIPTIEIADLETYAVLDEAITRLNTFHWILFTSANAVQAFARRSGVTAAGRQRAGNLTPEGPPRIAAIGAATARALEAIGLRTDLVPPKAIAESLAAALKPYARQANGKPTRFLLVRAEQARDVLPEALTAAGASVTIAPAYRNIIATGSIEAIQTLFRTGPPDSVTFTSSSAVRNLLDLLAAAGLKLPREVRRISIGPVTSATLNEAGYPPHAEAPEPTVAALAKVACAALSPP